MSQPANQHDILIATVGRPHGVRGLVHLHAATEDPAAVEDLGALYDGQGRAWTVSWRAPGIAVLTDASGASVADRDAAARLANLKLYVSRDRLPQVAEDEFYHADLLGLRAVTPEGAALGTVRLVHDYGAGVSLEIAGADRDWIVPFTRACVPVVDVAGNCLTVVPPHEIEVEGDLSGRDDVSVRT
ncbi:ribosomal RNA small subunit 16S rRNA processing protein RimM [Neoasaia chiangmaiensis NBRC 101099]|uniref:Ribosome maturation factor RimM n=1 Tax=Neoasaia chiangmaiensis TaxID=320497 RepID=A0A1U9KNX0_9PROT|nr:ribosome maturation factor RimM [Neoasaia chiangmaiensis]AQS87511.1 16S rRNA processing protein RimM [Neoasaia chiangmaiensis]GBR42443.1 ribosomal RNA small subunit 16S rRNA processing protein RimM [Neoasaia chiangmaiensis NBRC 101099]GEN16309.1 ribosome maturation factor RimM [Neoasaia chiangmaiensis]